jgi:hypothetical protein
LKNQEWFVSPAVATDQDLAVSPSRIAGVVPQYDGRETFEVTYQPRYDDAPCSRSLNGLGAATEASRFEPASKYLALEALLSSPNQGIHRLDFS